MKSALRYIVCLFLFTSCYVEDQNTFITDLTDPRMPQYSEEGANTAGAYINGEPWVCKKNTVSSIFSPSPYTTGTMKFYIALDSSGTFIAFEGGDILVGSNLSGASTSVGFFLKNKFLLRGSDLSSVAGQSIVLDGMDSFGQLVYSNQFNQIGEGPRGSGSLIIRNVNSDGGVLELSGTFGFSFQTEEGNSNVFSGRFDYEVDDNQFIP